MPSDFHRLAWVLLTLHVDREGRGHYNPSWVKSKIMPLRTDVTSEQIQYALKWFANKGMIQVYTVDDNQFFYIPTFKDYQGNTNKEAPSRIPPPPVKTNSRVTPELVQNNSTLDVYIDIDSDIDIEDKRGGEISPDQAHQQMVEETLGILATPSDIDALDEMYKGQVIKDDIQAYLAWRKENRNTPLFSISQAVNGIMLNRNKRMQDSNAKKPNRRRKNEGVLAAEKQRLLEEEHGNET